MGKRVTEEDRQQAKIILTDIFKSFGIGRYKNEVVTVKDVAGTRLLVVGGINKGLYGDLSLLRGDPLSIEVFNVGFEVIVR